MLRKRSRIYSVKLVLSHICHALVLYACDPSARGNTDTHVTSPTTYQAQFHALHTDYVI